MDYLSYYQKLSQLRLFDDDFMIVALKSKECVECILRIILQDETLKIKELHNQYSLKNLHGKSLEVDILAVNEDDEYMNIEVQRDNAGGDIKRARYHSSLIDGEIEIKKKEWKKLPKSYVIFITEKDIFQEGLPIYHIGRVIKENQKEVGDGQEIIYVNGEYEGEDEIGRLMHDFRCKEAKEMYNEVLAKRVERIKTKKEGEREMGKILDEIKNEGIEIGIVKGEQRGLLIGREEAKILSIQSIMENLNLTVQQAMEVLNIPPNEQEHYMKIIN